MTTKSTKVEKLVRNNIPDIMRAKGTKFNERTLDDQEYLHRLKEKIVEEANEVFNAKNSEELADELADILELVHAISQASGLTLQQIMHKQAVKREVKGGFDKKILITKP